MSELKKTIYLSRSFTLNRPGKEPLQLLQGRNLVEDDVAAHPYVKGHMTDAVTSAGDSGTAEALADALARNVELEGMVAQLKADMQAMAEAYSTPAGKKK